VKYVWVLLASFTLMGLSSAARASDIPLTIYPDTLNNLSLLQQKHLIFNDHYGIIAPAMDAQPAQIEIRNLKARLKEKLGLNIHPHLRISLDSVKSKSSLDQKSEIIALEPHLAPRNSGLRNAKGYGIAFKLKF